MEYNRRWEQEVQLFSTSSALCEREHLLRGRLYALQTATSDLCWITTSDGCIQEQQISWERFAGQNQEQSLGKGWLEAVHPRDRNHLETTLAQCVRTGRPGNSICLIRDAEDNYKCLSIRSVPVLDEEDHAQEVLCLGTSLMHSKQNSYKRRNWTEITHLQALLIDMAHDSIVISDSSGRILAWNQGATELHGYSEQEALGQRGPDLFQTHYPQFLSEEAFVQTLLNDEKWEGELEHVYHDGRRIIVETRLAVIRSEEGQPLAILAVSRDVTEHKHTEQQLKASIQEAEMAGQIGLLAADLVQDNAESSSWDKSAHPDYPGSLAQFLQIVYPDDRAATENTIHNALEQKKDYMAEFRVIDPEQHIHWYTSYGRALYDEQGIPVRLMGVTLNITERKHTEQALQEATEQITTILESISEAFLSVNKEWRYTYVNSQACRDLGMSRDELLGKVIWEIHPDLQDTIVAEKYHETMDERKCTTFDFFFEPTERWLMMRTYPTKEGMTIFVTDVTERFHIEEDLRKTAARFHRLVEANIGGVAVSDSLGHVIEANDAFLKMSDSTRDELDRGEINWRELTPLEYHTADRYAIQQLWETGVFLPYRKEYLTKQGKRVPVFIMGATIEIEEDVEKHITFIVDLTRQKEMEKQREHLLHLVSLAHDAILVHDPEGRILSWNGGAESLYGWTTQETLGLIAHTLLQTHCPVSHEDIDYALEKRGQWEGELIHTCRDGRRVIVESRQVLTRDDQGAPTAIVEINRDVTEQRRLEQIEQATQAEREARLNVLQLILDCLSSGVFLAQGPQLRLLMANQAVASLMGAKWQQGQTRDDFLLQQGIHFFTMDGQPLDATHSPVGRAMITGEPVISYPAIIRQPDGTRLPVLLDAIPLERLHHLSILPQEIATVFTPTEQVVLVVSHDVAALKEAEELKDQFVSLATHELRTPVTIIAGYADHLLVRAARGKEHQLDEWQREKVLEIKQASWQLTRLTEDLLDVTRMQAGQLRLELNTADLVAITRQVIKQLQVTTDRHQILLHTSLPQLWASVDAFRIKQVLSNLLSNAIKYSPGGGPIEVTLEGCQTHEARFRIRDHGMGIPRAQQTHLFGRFVRAENARAAGIRGNGLGLYLCRELVERHGGHIYLESEEGAGSTFYLSLPLTVLAEN